MTNSDLAARLGVFLPTWRAASMRDPQVARPSAFLERFAALRPVLPERPAAQPVNVARLRDTLAQMAAPLARLRASGATINPWVVAGLRRDEVRNAKVLATFWSPQACGDQAIAFLDAFCRRLDDPQSLLPTTDELRAGYTVRTEHCPVGERNERVDLTIEGAGFVLGIEVKIGADKQPEQLERYTNSIARWARQRGRRRAAVVFLAPYPGDVADVIDARWNDVAAAARTLLPGPGEDRSFHHHLLDGFIRHIADF